MHRPSTDVLNHAQLNQLALQHPHRPVIVSIWNRATCQRHQYRFLCPAQRPAPFLLHFIPQHTRHTPRPETLADIAHRRLTDPEGLG